MIVLHPEHIPAFSWLLPPELSGCLEQPGTFALGLLDHREDGWHPMGILVSEVEESTVEVVWIYTLPEARGCGNGTLLLHTLMDTLSRSGTPCTLMTFLEAGSPVSLFFLYAGFDLIAVGHDSIYEATVGALVEGRLGNRPTLPGVLPLGELPKVYLRAFNHAMADEDAMVEFPVRPEDYLPCSMALLEQGRVTGMLLYTQDPGTSSISMVYRYVAREDPRRAAALTCASISAMGRLYAPETPVRLLTMDNLSRLMASSCAKGVDEERIIALTYELEPGNPEGVSV